MWQKTRKIIKKTRFHCKRHLKFLKTFKKSVKNSQKQSKKLKKSFKLGSRVLKNGVSKTTLLPNLNENLQKRSKKVKKVHKKSLILGPFVTTKT